MPIDINGACSSMMLGLKKEEPELDWLTFTAVDDGTTVSLNKKADSPSIVAELEYRIGKGAWQEYTWDGTNGKPMVLANTGDTCQMRAKYFNDKFSNGASNWFIFNTDKNVYVSGNILSLLSKEMKVKTVPDGAFYALFYKANILSAPSLGFPHDIVLRGAAFGEIFNRSFLSGTIIFSPQSVEIGKSVYHWSHRRTQINKVIADFTGLFAYDHDTAFSGIFSFCEKLTEIVYVGNTWADHPDWVHGVSPTGDFYCPADLPLIWDDSHIPIGWTAHPEGKEPVPWQDPNESKYLRFTAEQDGSLLRLDKSKDVPELNARLEYKINAGNWQKYTWNGTEGALVSLPKVGDCVKFRAEDRNETFSNKDAQYKFTSTAPLRYSGDVLSLLDKELKFRDVPAYCFKLLCNKLQCKGDICIYANSVSDYSFNLFNNNNLESIHTVSINVVSLRGEKAFDYAFGNSRNLILSDISIQNVDNSTRLSLLNVFINCLELSDISVNFRQWRDGFTNGWVNNVSPTGTFTCPSELPVVFGNSNIPHGWKVDNGKTEVTEEEILNACYQYGQIKAVPSRLLLSPDFFSAIDSNISYVYKGKTYWTQGEPLPNPYVSEASYYNGNELGTTFANLFNVTEIKLLWGGLKITAMKNSFLNDRKLITIDLSGIDLSECTVDNMSKAFFQCTSVTTAYARTQADCDKLNASEGKPTTWEFVVHPDLLNVPSFTLGNAGDFSGQYKPTGNLTPEGLPVYANEEVFNFKMKPTLQEDGTTRFVFFSEQGFGNSYVCNTPLETPIDTTACTGRRQLLKDLTYTGGDGQQYTVTITFDDKPKKLKQFTVTETSAGADAVFRADGDTGAFVTQDSTPSIYPGARFVYAESSKTYQIIPVSPDIDPTWVSTGTPADGSFSQENLNGSNPYSALGMTLDLWFKDFVYE